MKVRIQSTEGKSFSNDKLLTILEWIVTLKWIWIRSWQCATSAKRVLAFKWVNCKVRHCRHGTGAPNSASWTVKLWKTKSWPCGFQMAVTALNYHGQCFPLRELIADSVLRKESRFIFEVYNFTKLLFHYFLVVGYLVSSLFGWLIGWLVDWLVGGSGGDGGV